MALLPSSRHGLAMPELPCHPIPFVMQRVACDLRRPRAGGCERTRENSAYIFERWGDGRVWWAAGAGCAVDLRSQWLVGLRVVWVEDRGAKTAQY